MMTESSAEEKRGGGREMWGKTRDDSFSPRDEHDAYKRYSEKFIGVVNGFDILFIPMIHMTIVYRVTGNNHEIIRSNVSCHCIDSRRLYTSS